MNLVKVPISYATENQTMTAIQIGELPQSALLRKYTQQGAYTDCYFMDMPRAVLFPEYIEAFYTTSLFKVERKLLALLASKPSNDLQAKQLANGQTGNFAAWHVEGKEVDQLLLCDFQGRTRSWLMREPIDNQGTSATRLYFGSAVVPLSSTPSGKKAFGLAFHVLYGFHQLYTKALMQSARSALIKKR